MSNFSKRDVDLLIELYFCSAFRLADKNEGFELKAHECNPGSKLSPFKFVITTESNPNPGPLNDEQMDRIGEVVSEQYFKCGTIRTKFAAGMPFGADSLADSFVRALKKIIGEFSPEVIRLNKSVIDGKRQISTKSDERNNLFKTKVILLENTTTSGASIIESAKALRKKGAIVNYAITFIDRGQGAERRLLENEIVLKSCFKAEDVIALYREKDLITSTNYKRCIDYIKNNQF